MKRLGTILLFAALASAQLAPTDHYVTYAPPEKVKVAAGAPATVAFDFRVNQGMHINSDTPKSEFLIPTKLRFMPPTDIAVGKLEYPKAEELELSFSKEKLSVYTGDFRIKAQVNASRSATTGPYTVHGELKYQACNDKACFPPKTIEITVPYQIQ